jgi:hypothetical protein
MRPADLPLAERGQILAEDPIDLDGRRGIAARKAAGLRRQLAAVAADPAAPRRLQEELGTCFSPRPPPARLKPWSRPVIF